MTASDPPSATLLRLDDGRDLEVLEEGDPRGFPLLFHGGQPSAAVPSAPLDAAARDQGLRLIGWSRPGYGASTPRRATTARPSVADDVADSAALLDRLGVGEFVTLGWSGGGPRALACAALLPRRCRAATSLAGVAPFDADGLAWTDGMAEENVAEYGAAVQGPAAYERLLEENLAPVMAASPAEIADALGGLVPPVDRAALDAGLADHLSRSMAHAAAQGVVGVRDDGLALVAPWGFDPASIEVPVAVWQGTADAMVPAAHGEWLAARVPGAHVHLLEGEGHLSLVDRMPAILAELRELAGLGATD